MFQDSCLDELPGLGPVSLPVSVLVMVEPSEATVPVTGDDVELVRVQGVRCEEVLEEVKPCVGFVLWGRVELGDPELLVHDPKV